MPVSVEVYADESGHASEGPIFALAGLGGTTEQWTGFDEEWLGTLQEFGLNEPFHAVDFEGLRRQFEPLRADRARAMELHRRLTEIINRHKLLMFGAVVVLDEWRAMDEEAKRANDPYFLCTEAVVAGLGSDSALTDDRTFELHFWFEKRKDTAAAAERMFAKIREHPAIVGRDRLATFDFGDKASPRLQAADLVAYEVRKRAIAELNDDKAERWQSEQLLPNLYIGKVLIWRKRGCNPLRRSP